MDRSPAQHPKRDDSPVQPLDKRAALHQARGMLAGRAGGRRLSDELVAERRAQARREGVVSSGAA